jgi:hypothetical protein
MRLFARLSQVTAYVRKAAEDALTEALGHGGVDVNVDVVRPSAPLGVMRALCCVDDSAC